MPTEASALDERVPTSGGVARARGESTVRLGTPARRPAQGTEVHQRPEQEHALGEWHSGAVRTEGRTASAGPLDAATRAERLQGLQSLIELLRPAVQSDGGDLILVSADPERGEVEVQLEGACSSCAISATTLQAGVERILKDRLPWVTSVRGRVDDAFDLDLSVSLGRGGYVPRA